LSKESIFLKNISKLAKMTSFLKRHSLSSCQSHSSLVKTEINQEDVSSDECKLSERRNKSLNLNKISQNSISDHMENGFETDSRKNSILFETDKSIEELKANYTEDDEKIKEISLIKEGTRSRTLSKNIKNKERQAEKNEVLKSIESLKALNELSNQVEVLKATKKRRGKEEEICKEFEKSRKEAKRNHIMILEKTESILENENISSENDGNEKMERLERLERMERMEISGKTALSLLNRKRRMKGVGNLSERRKTDNTDERRSSDELKRCSLIPHVNHSHKGTRKLHENSRCGEHSFLSTDSTPDSDQCAHDNNKVISIQNTLFPVPLLPSHYNYLNRNIIIYDADALHYLNQHSGISITSKHFFHNLNNNFPQSFNSPIKINEEDLTFEGNNTFLISFYFELEKKIYSKLPNLPSRKKYLNLHGLLIPPKTDDTIIFNSKFENGNLKYAVKLDESPMEFDLFLDHDFNTQSYSQWYYFSVTNIKKGKIQ
jgi:hypothetical protein